VNRLNRRLESATQQRSEPILRVIRRKCLDCSAGQPSEVRLCPATSCPLHPYRMGENPFARPRGRPGDGFLTPFKKSPLLAGDSDGKGLSLDGGTP
jgi:hypothetical protein